MTALLAEVRACRVCAPALPHPPRPVLRAGAGARVLIVGQAPGRRVHDTGIPWNDPSGDTLRAWLGIDRTAFYDESRIAIIPAGLCYPGTGESGDLPPRPECAPRWHPRLRAALPEIELTLAIGRYAQALYSPRTTRRPTLAATVRLYLESARTGAPEDDPKVFPLPHPSPRNRRWLTQNRWFERSVIPLLRERFRAALE